MLLALAVLEVPYQLWTHRDRLEMTRQEVRDELRELEGSPHTKRRLKVLRRRFARMRMMAEVAKADVVVTTRTIMRRRSPAAPAAGTAFRTASGIRRVAAAACTRQSHHFSSAA
jgi:hypothetical protein